MKSRCLEFLSPWSLYKLFAYSAALALIAFNLGFSFYVFSPVPIVDGWPLLHRIMEAKTGAIGWDDYLLRTHGAHLHFIIYALGLLDYEFFGGRQIVQHAVSVTSIAGMALFMAWIIAREAARQGQPPFFTMLIVIAAVGHVTRLQDEETLLVPFQAVLSVSRFVYVFLLWAFAYTLCTGRCKYYSYLLGFAVFSSCFHGSGHLFGLCLIFLHILLREPWRRIALSTLPLLFSLIIQKIYARGLSEMSMLGNVMKIENIPEFFYGVFAYFASPLRVFIPYLDMRLLLGLGAAFFMFTLWFFLSSIHRDWDVRKGWRPRDSEAEPLPAIPASRAFFAALMMMILLSAASAALIWLVRAGLPGFGKIVAWQALLTSSRYACFSLLSYLYLLYVLCRAKQGAGLSLAAITAAAFIILSVSSSWLSARDFDRDQRLNLSAAALAAGIPAFAPETDAIWPEVQSDPYWKTELPKTLAYLREQKRGIWYRLPDPGDKLADTQALEDVRKLSVSEKGFCRVRAGIGRDRHEFLLPVTDAGYRVIGYLTPLRKTDNDKAIGEGFIPCTETSTPLRIGTAGRNAF